MNEQLFKSVFSNIVIIRRIYYFASLYKKNEYVEFISNIELRQYKEREFISNIGYWGKDILKPGDLPIGGVLKEVKLCQLELLSIKGDAIPYGVEILEYSDINEGYTTTPFSTLPITINTIINARVVIPNSRKNINSGINNFYNKEYKIPSNITSIKFLKCPTISINNLNDDGYVMVIPNTVKRLVFSEGWKNDDIPLSLNDIPNGVTYLDLGDYEIKKLRNATKRILPNSIKELKLKAYDMTIKDSNGLFNFLPPNIESLKLKNCTTITINSNLNKLTSIKKLIISIYEISIIEINSLPTSLNELSITSNQGIVNLKLVPHKVKILKLHFYAPENSHFIKGSIPNSVLSLEINKIIDEQGILPPSLTYLELKNPTFGYPYSNEEIMKMMSILPKSLNSITLPKSSKDYNIKLPLAINKVTYSRN